MTISISELSRYSMGTLERWMSASREQNELAKLSIRGDEINSS